MANPGDELIQVNMYRDWRGLNMGNTWWKNHDMATMTNVEDICPDLYLMDVYTDPTISNVYAQDAGIDGSRFEYNSLAKTPVTLTFRLHYDDNRDFLDKKHDIQQYFASKAGFIMQTNFHPTLHACCYTNKVEIKPTSDHDAVFTITMDNALGMWFTNSTRYLEKDWDKAIMQDLRVPVSFNKENSPSWSLKPGHNRIWIGGDVMSQLTNPIMDCKIFLYGCSNHVAVINHTSNTMLEAEGRGVRDDCVWMNLNFGHVDAINPKNKAITYTPLNQYSNSLDLWLDPGWNDVELQGAQSGYVDTRFYFANF